MSDITMHLEWVAQLTDHMDCNCYDTLKALAAEVESLRAKLAAAEGALTSQHENLDRIITLESKLAAAEAEIARLMVGDKLYTDACLAVPWNEAKDGEEVADVVRRVIAERDTARAELESAKKAAATAVENWATARAEVARLTAETCDLTGRLDIERQSAGVERAEAARLRELLRAALDGVDEYWITLPDGEKWHDEVDTLLNKAALDER